MKIEEAKKKICPFITAVDRGGWDRNNGSPANINCICDKCMSWEYHYTNDLDSNNDYILSKVEGYCRRLAH